MTPQPQVQIQTQPRIRTRTRRLSPCRRHPSGPITGFCALCLSERLAGLHPSPHLEPSSSSASGGGGPELRRSKSVSVAKSASHGLSEPRRKSCDVRVRNTLFYLFNLDDEKSALNRELKVESKNLGFSRIVGPVFESREEDNNGEGITQIRVSEVEEELKTMKEHIDLEFQSRKHTVRDLRDIAGSLASVFSKNLEKWRHTQKKKKHSSCHGGGIVGSSTTRGKRPSGGQFRETQSEIGDYGFGRRSCDTEPGFSVDAGRISMDDSRYSFDEPRASWDGYLIARTIPRLTPMLSVVENVILAPVNNRSVNYCIEEERGSINEDETTSGGSAQTNSDSSSSQRRSSFDCSSSVRSLNRKTLGIEVDEGKTIANAKVSPASSDIFQQTKLVITERELKDWHLNTLKDNHLENLESVSKGAPSVATGSTPNRFKKSSRWHKVWNIWGFTPRHGDNKYEDFTGSVIDHPVADACEKQGGFVDGEEKGTSIGKLTRSSSCVSSRNSCKVVGSYHNTRSVAETRGCAKKGRGEFVLERNRSARYSPSNFDNGLLRFYLTPFRSYRRSKSGKTRLNDSHSMARTDLRSN